MKQVILIIVFAMYGWWMARGVKTQWVRLVDVFVYGPFLLYLAFRETEVSFKQLFLLFLGATTITYNARNYLHTRLA